MLAPSAKKMAIPAIVFLAAACAGNDITKNGPNANDIWSSDYLFTSKVTVTLSPATATVPVGGTIELTGSGKDKDGHSASGKIGALGTWRSSDTTVAKVSRTGIITGVHNGTATITVNTFVGSGSASVKVGTGSSTSTGTISKPVSGSTTTSSGSTTSGSGSTGSTTTPPPATTPTAPTTPAAPADPTPGAGQGLSGLQLIGDDFSKYGSTSDLLAKVSRNISGGTGTSNLIYSDGANAQLVEIDKSVTYNGHATMKYNQPAGVAMTPEMWVAMPKQTSHVWIRAHIRFSPGYITTGTINAANAYKLLGWAYTGTDGSGRLEITNTTQYDFYWGTTDRSTNTTSGGGNHTSGGNISTEWSDGAWYTYIIEIDNSQPTGVTRFYWARGTDAPKLRATTTGTMKNGSLFPALSYVNFGMNFNQVRTASQTQALWYGDWEIVDGNAHSNPFGLK